MVDAPEFCRTAGIDSTALEVWIEEGWLRPGRSGSDWSFSTTDLVRARLIVDLRGPMGVNEEGVGVVLHLLDQIHGLRRALGIVAASAAGRNLSGAPDARPTTDPADPAAD
jgi:chaperone modulatory protein CbpM